MTVIQRIEHWGDTHHPTWLDTIRVALGVFLFVRGLGFITDDSGIAGLVGELNLAWSMLAIHYVAFAHLVGGFLIAIGCITRIAAAFQIPILFVAVFFVNLTRGFSYLNSELWLSVLTLLLLILFYVVGSGKFSVDQWMKHKND
ncbi:DoxX family protein [Siphonobacter aquaeclarae]|jgi:putative oxidoreductase|uniref:Uncharacterized membrane protein YphA, DoxX/SURF4 family n=1 Tax=Siphonobacter aquaeclarae TaxID=563176 RepID=A0A1G9YEV6_9BACT|nr:DoxX family protein [Siphonobacter aquaeclarae]MBO9640453.1 DoxX family protein [Siphonobacter aquaeclarae]SDN07001.1 Uncharacterized membrane protein YphA, DoxX/SURF4 family [Siphonobacter aquaeclarae]